MTRTSPSGPEWAEQQRDWLIAGIEAGYISDPFCDSHEGPPLTDDEAQDYEEGGDPCLHCVRLWEDHNGGDQ